MRSTSDESNQCIYAIGEVAWRRAIDLSEQLPAGLGIRFLEISNNSWETLEKYLDRFEADFTHDLTKFE
jgi:hypothetical protein